MDPLSTDKPPDAMKNPQSKVPSAVAMHDFDALLAESMSVALRTTGIERQRFMQAMKDFVASATSFRFLDLPTELRNRIYEFSVVSEPGRRLLLSCSTNCHVRDLAVQLSITRVSRQLRSESLPIFYGQNEFEAHIRGGDFSSLTDHLKLFEHEKHIRRIELKREGNYLQRGCVQDLRNLVIWCATTQSTKLSFGVMTGGEPFGMLFWNWVIASVMMGHELKRQRASLLKIHQAFDQWVPHAAGPGTELPYSISEAGIRNRLCSYEEYLM